MKTFISDANIPITTAHDYLIRDVSGFHKVSPGEDGVPHTSEDSGRVEGNPGNIKISFPDHLPEEIILKALTAIEKLT